MTSRIHALRPGSVAVLACLVLLACGSTPTSVRTVPPLPATALPGLDSRTRTLDLADVSTEGGGESLDDLLHDAGFVSGSEREFFGRGGDFSRVVARTLLFDDRQGAADYLAWLGAHGVRDLGASSPEGSPAIGEVSVLRSFDSGCDCTSDVPAFLVAWGREGVVLWLYAAGEGASRRSVVALARGVDADYAGAFEGGAGSA